MDRRTWIGLSAAVAAAAGGAGWLLRPRHAGTSGATTAGATGAASAASVAGDDALWSSRFDRPEGGTLALDSLRGRPLLINFWATWCPPCVKELPQIDQFAREQTARGAQGWQVIGLAVDTAAPVRAFLKKTPLSFPVGLAGFGGTELARQLGNTQGGLPFTVVFDARGELMHRKLGETHLQELQQWVAQGARGPGQ